MEIGRNSDGGEGKHECDERGTGVRRKRDGPRQSSSLVPQGLLL